MSSQTPNNAVRSLLAVALAAGISQSASAQLSVVPPSSFDPGVFICKPGFGVPQCVATPYDTTLNLAAQANGAAPAVAVRGGLAGDGAHAPASRLSIVAFMAPSQAPRIAACADKRP